MTSLAAVPRPCPDDCLECWLQQSLDRHPCPGTLDQVQDWAAGRAADLDHLTDFLAGRGGFCDCEVLLNVLLDGRELLGELVLSCGS